MKEFNKWKYCWHNTVCFARNYWFSWEKPFNLRNGTEIVNMCIVLWISPLFFSSTCYGIDYLQHSDHKVHVELTMSRQLHAIILLYAIILKHQSFLFAHWFGSFLHRVRECCVAKQKIVSSYCTNYEINSKIPCRAFLINFEISNNKLSTRIYAYTIWHNMTKLPHFLMQCILLLISISEDLCLSLKWLGRLNMFECRSAAVIFLE